MKFKEYIIIIITTILLISLSGCIKTYEDLIPSSKDLGFWDGNYIYHGNMRTTTTGEDTEILVKEINYEGIIYKFVEMCDFIFIKDEIYMILNMKDKNNISEDKYDTSMLIHYSIKNKTASVKYFSKNQNEFLSRFYHVTDEDFLISKNNMQHNGLIKYQILSEEFLEIPKADRYIIVEDYLIITKDSEVKYTKINNIEFNTIEGAKTNSNFTMVNIDGKKLLRIFSSSFASAFNFIGSLHFYDFEADLLFTAWEYEDYKNVHIIGDNYFMIGDTKSYEYVSSLRDSDTKRYEVLDSYLSVNNTLYKIEYKDNVFIVEKVHQFEDNVSYASGRVLDDGKILLTKKWVKKGTQIFPGGERAEDVVFDPIDKTLTKFKKEKVNTISNPLDYGIELNNYIYYIKSVRYGALMISNYGYYLVRYDKETEDRKVMQFFAIEHDEIKGTRYAVDFWYEDFSFKTENYLILNY